MRSKRVDQNKKMQLFDIAFSVVNIMRFFEAWEWYYFLLHSFCFVVFIIKDELHTAQDDLKKGCIHPTLQIALLENSWHGKELNKFWPPNSSDDLCLVFCIKFSCSTLQYSDPVSLYLHGMEKIAGCQVAKAWCMSNNCSSRIFFYVSFFYELIFILLQNNILLQMWGWFVYSWGLGVWRCRRLPQGRRWITG